MMLKKQALGRLLMHPRKRLDVLVLQVEGETLILDRQAEKVHQLNPTASFIWSQCDGETPVPEIAKGVAQSFDVAPETAASDVAALIANLKELDLLIMDSESEATVKEGVHSERV